MNGKKGQVFSGDAVIAIVVLVLAIIGFLIFSQRTGDERATSSLVEENSVLADVLSAQQTGGDVPIIGERLDEARIRQLHALDYQSLKRELGMKSDFCIHFTDTNGNLVPIAGVWFLGSPDINVSVGTFLFTCNGTLLGASSGGVLTQPECNDQGDNDADLSIDYPADRQCATVVDGSEAT